MSSAREPDAAHWRTAGSLAELSSGLFLSKGDRPTGAPSGL